MKRRPLMRPFTFDYQIKESNMDIFEEQTITYRERVVTTVSRDKKVIPFATNMKKAREEAGLSMFDVVDELLEVGSVSTVKGWETGKSRPTLRTFMHLCDLYKVQPNDLLGFSKEAVKD